MACKINFFLFNYIKTKNTFAKNQTWTLFGVGIINIKRGKLENF